MIRTLLVVAAVVTQGAQIDVRARAADFISQLAAGKYDAVEQTFTDQMKTAMPVDRLAMVWGQITTQAGKLVRQGAVTVTERAPFKIVVVTCEFERAAIDVQITYDDKGAASGLFFRPAAPPAVPSSPPAYADSAKYRERDVQVPGSRGALPGTLTVPVGAGPFPAVVLVHGSGANDRDETIGPNKLFRDLALGLGSRGIAVLRYEKRTKQYPGQLTSLPNATVKDETIDDALSAVTLLRSTPEIDPKRILVLGHSLGGMVAPRIGASDPGLAGLIVMAGAARPLERAMAEQIRYLAEADGTVTPAEEAQIREMENGAAQVATLTPADAAAKMMVLNAPASYWLDLRGYDPPAAAAKVARPMLILQGERDYQVTMQEFARWKAALSSRVDVAFKSYPALNHVFIPGTGKSVPAEYNVPGHVPEDVVRDIAEWIGKLK